MKKTTTQKLVMLLIVIAVIIFTAIARADMPSDIFIDMGPSTLDEVREDADYRATGGFNGPGYRSYGIEEMLFQGTYKPTDADRIFVIHSDDGFKITIKRGGEIVYFLDRKEAPQHLPYLPASFHVLPFILEKDVEYEVIIEYRNKIYRENYSLMGGGGSEFIDVDGLSLYCIFAVVATTVVKIPLGGSESVSEYGVVGKIYVPTKWGGKLTIQGRSLSLYYTDGSDLTAGGATHQQLVGNKLKPVKKSRAGAGATLVYNVPKDKHGWYYVRQDVAVPQAAQNGFTQQKAVTKKPWSCPWFPMSDEQTPNLYDVDGCLDMYDRAYGTAARAREMRVHRWQGGHYVAKDLLRESDAERTWGYDFNGNGVIEAGVAWNFWSGTPPGGSFSPPWTPDGDTTDEVDSSWWGHCDQASSVVIQEEEPKGAFAAPNGVVFTAELKKGLLVALYHDEETEFFEGYDIKPHEWHRRLEENILGKNQMFAADVHNSGAGRDQVWNYPIFEIKNAEYKEKPGQTNERIVEVTAQVMYWKHPSGTATAGTAVALNYKYNVKYNAAGEADDSTNTDWLSLTKPDSVWRPHKKRTISPYWAGQLDFQTIETIIPLK
jgi:hypothetical protein